MLALLLFMSTAPALPPYAEASGPSLVVEEDPFTWTASTQIVAPGQPGRVKCAWPSLRVMWSIEISWSSLWPRTISEKSLVSHVVVKW